MAHFGAPLPWTQGPVVPFRPAWTAGECEKCRGWIVVIDHRYERSDASSTTRSVLRAALRRAAKRHRCG